MVIFLNSKFFSFFVHYDSCIITNDKNRYNTSDGEE